MSFTTPNGTYGITMKPNRLMRWFIAGQVKTIRRGATKTMGFKALVMITTGRKTGNTYENPVGYWTQPDGSWIVCASAAGTAKNPSWYRNLAAAPDQARIVIAGEEIPVSAEELHGAERESGWQQIVGAAPRFADYAKKTDRQLPVIRLTRRQ